MMSTSGILCIDFGTSSIRAAIVKDGRLKPEVLELGEAFKMVFSAQKNWGLNLK